MVIVAGKRAFRRLGRMVLVLALVLLLSTCVDMAPAGPVLSLVDANSVVAVVIDSPFKLFQALDAFWNAAGIQTVAGSDLGGFLGKNLPDVDAAQNALDFARPWALAVLPLSPGSKETRTIVYLPYRGQSTAYLNKLGAQGSMKLVTQASGYAVFATGDGPVEFPPSHPLDLRRLAAYPAASIKVWADPNLLRRLTMNEWKPMESAAHSFVSGTESGAGPALSALEEMGLSLLAQLHAADAAIVPDARGISFRVGATLVPGSQAERLVAEAAAAPSALDWTGQVRADALYGYSWSLEPSATGELYTALATPLLTALGVDSAASSHIAALETRWADAAGARGAAAFDMAIDMNALKGLGGNQDDPGAISKAIAQGMKIDLELMQEVKDEPQVSRLMRGVGTDADLQAFRDVYRDKLGLDFQLTNSDMNEGPFAYGILRFDFKVTDAAKLSALGGEKPAEQGGALADAETAAQAGTQAALEALGNILSMKWTVADGRLFATTSDAAALKALATRPAAEPALADDPAFAAFAKTVPATTLSVGYLSVRRLAEFARDIMAQSPGGSPLANIDPSKLSSWYGYLSATAADSSGPASLETGFFIPASDIMYLIQLGSTMAKPNSQAME